jgi:hypothetical protein
VYIARNTEFAPKAGLLWKALRRSQLIASLVQEACEFGDPATQLPLQAADLVAFELLQAAKARESGREPRRWPFLQLQECSHHFLFIDRGYVELNCPSDEVLKGLPGLEEKNAPR